MVFIKEVCDLCGETMETNIKISTRSRKPLMTRLNVFTSIGKDNVNNLNATIKGYTKDTLCNNCLKKATSELDNFLLNSKYFTKHNELF